MNIDRLIAKYGFIWKLIKLWCNQLKGEKQLVEKILQTEINLLLSLRDGSALMQHMEDFYYVTLLEVWYFLFCVHGDWNVDPYHIS